MDEDKTWEEKQLENQRVYDAARKIIESWPEWKIRLAEEVYGYRRQSRQDRR